MKKDLYKKVKPSVAAGVGPFKVTFIKDGGASSKKEKILSIPETDDSLGKAVRLHEYIHLKISDDVVNFNAAYNYAKKKSEEAGLEAPDQSIFYNCYQTFLDAIVNGFGNRIDSKEYDISNLVVFFDPSIDDPDLQKNLIYYKMITLNIPDLLLSIARTYKLKEESLIDQILKKHSLEFTKKTKHFMLYKNKIESFYQYIFRSYKSNLRNKTKQVKRIYQLYLLLESIIDSINKEKEKREKELAEKAKSKNKTTGKRGTEEEESSEEEVRELIKDGLTENVLECSDFSDVDWGTLKELRLKMHKANLRRIDIYNKKTKSGFVGAFRYPHNALPGGNLRVFGHRRRDKKGLVVLLDLSGSMQISEKDLLDLFEEVPNIMVYGYKGEKEEGYIFEMVNGRNGTVCNISDIPDYTMNVVDLPALRYIVNKHRNYDKLWISDGQVTGKYDKQNIELFLECDIFCRANKIKRMEKLEDFLYVLSLNSFSIDKIFND